MVDKDEMTLEIIEDYNSDRLKKKKYQSTGRRDSKNVRKTDIRRDPRSALIKSLKGLVRIDNQINNMTIDTGSPVSFLKWARTKQIMKECPKIKFLPAESLILSAQFVDYNKQPILILGALKADIRSARWEVKGVSFLVLECHTR